MTKRILACESTYHLAELGPKFVGPVKAFCGKEGWDTSIPVTSWMPEHCPECEAAKKELDFLTTTP